MAVSIAITSIVAYSEPSDRTDLPVTVVGIRALIENTDELNKCKRANDARTCWVCSDDSCIYSESGSYETWTYSNTVLVQKDTESLECWVSSNAIAIQFGDGGVDTPVSIRVPGDPGLTLHELRPVYLTLDDRRFINPEDGPYSKMEFRDSDNKIVDLSALFDEMQNSNRITVEVWNVSDQKILMVESGEALSKAVETCQSFVDKLM